MSNSTQTFDKTPSVFSFQRSIIVTAGAFYNEIDGKHDKPVFVVRHGIRGTQNVNNSSEREVAMVQVTESAMLDHKATALVVKFGVRLVDLSYSLHSCSGGKGDTASRVRQSVMDFVARAKASEGVDEVARRVARNIANGSFLWRNRTLAKSVTVSVVSQDQSITFDALSVPMSTFSNYSANEIRLAAILAGGMRGDLDSSIEVTARVDFGVRGATQVYPSQAFVENKPGSSKSKSKDENNDEKKSAGVTGLLYKLTSEIPETDSSEIEFQKIMGQAAFRDQKISNRLRTFDTWYPDYKNVGKPIPIEPSGASLDLMTFFRRGDTTAFSMFSRLNQIDPHSPEGMYCIGSMIRGGVYGGATDKVKPVKASEVDDPVSALAEGDE